MRELQTVIESESQSLERMIRSLSQLSARLDAATDSGRIERTAASIDTLTARLAGASADLDETSRSLASILGKIDRGEGSIGRMVNDPELYESLTATLENLQAASEEVALLTKDVRESPEKYLKGLKFSVF
jgi:phospholipid/cholesterol/gamma-HCH transport system substrate-binding protein